MPYHLNTENDQREMLQLIGVDSLEELFDSVPPDLRLERLLDLPAALCELELTGQLSQLAAQNRGVDRMSCFLGGGSYDHFVPAVVDALTSRGEFYTSYTPYQPEVSQGNLQAMFEYQTLICQLTGMDVSNASLYDGGTAAVEAVLMAMSVTRRHQKVVVLGGVHPQYCEIVATYLENLDAELVELPVGNGTADLAQVANAVDDQTACVLLQHPNFFGCLEAAEQISELAHQRGALAIHIFDPISLGLLKRPGDLGADIAVAEGQSLGTPLLYGGPYLGIMACGEQFVRRLPGRIAGQTVDSRGHRCWVLTLQTREQHIRREKATSNICTNQGLFALRAAIYLACQGPQGLAETADHSFRKARYAADLLTRQDRFSLAFPGPFGKEFLIRDRDNQVDALLQRARQHDCLAGLPVKNWYPELEDCFLVAVTEKRTRQEIDAWARILATSECHVTTHA